MIMPAPKLLTSLPEASNRRTGSTVGLVGQPLLPPHRSATQIDFPSLSTSIALIAPHIRPSGSWKWFSTVWYGFGKLFETFWPCALETRTPMMTAIAAYALNRDGMERRILQLRCMFETQHCPVGKLLLRQRRQRPSDLLPSDEFAVFKF